MPKNEIELFSENITPELNRLKAELERLISIREQMDLLADGATQVTIIIDALRAVGKTVSNVSESIMEIEEQSTSAIQSHILALQQIATETRELMLGAVRLSDDLEQKIRGQLNKAMKEIQAQSEATAKSAEERITAEVVGRNDSIKMEIKRIVNLIRDSGDERKQEWHTQNVELKRVKNISLVLLILVLVAQIITMSFFIY